MTNTKVTPWDVEGNIDYDKEFDKKDETELNNVKRCPDKFCISPSPTMRVKSGEKAHIFFKIKPTKGDMSDDASNNGIGCIAGLAGAGTSCSAITIEAVTSDLGTPYTSAEIDSKFVLSGPGFNSVKKGDDESKMYTMTANIPDGTYFMQLKFSNGVGSASDLSESVKDLTLIVG